MAKEISNINESIYGQFLYKKALEDDEDFLCLQTYHLRYVYHVGIVRIALFCPKEQHGKASFYSKRSTGARTASGQRLHHDSLTCAHRYYPFGTRLKVTNLSNNKSVIVKVIDRGPFGRGRIIDLSWAAAKAIGMIAQGVASVKIETVENPIPYRPEENKLPHVDFEVAESDYEFKPTWKHTKEQEIATKEPKSTKEPNQTKNTKGKLENTEVNKSQQNHTKHEFQNKSSHKSQSKNSHEKRRVFE